MTLSSYRLVPRAGAGFHFGRTGREIESSEESFPSDSLFAALVVAYTHLRGDPAAFLAAWEAGEPPWVTSSVFPYAGNLPLLPMPRLQVNFRKPDGPGARKGLKRLRYVSPRIFESLINGVEMDEQWSEGRPLTSLQGGAVWLHASEEASLPAHMRDFVPERMREQRIWDNGKVPRVAIDRRSQQSSIYFVGRTVYAEDCGLWFAADVRREELLLRELLGYLGDSGIGGERSAGYGHFEVQTDLPALKLPHSRNEPRWITLSRYYPLPGELQAGVLGGKASYELVDVGGWMGTAEGPAQRRRHVRMIEAGSVLSNIRQATPGGLADVRPVYENGMQHGHPVYRAGLALTAGVHAREDAS